ncbi:hypothetical protein D3C81_1369250 [compost metagenome]
MLMRNPHCPDQTSPSLFRTFPILIAFYQYLQHLSILITTISSMQNYVSAKSTAQALQFSELFISYFTFSAITCTLTFYSILLAAHLLPVTTCPCFILLIPCFILLIPYFILLIPYFILLASPPTTATCFMLLVLCYLLLTTYYLDFCMRVFSNCTFFDNSITTCFIYSLLSILLTSCSMLFTSFHTTHFLLRTTQFLRHAIYFFPYYSLLDSYFLLLLLTTHY